MMRPIEPAQKHSMALHPPGPSVTPRPRFRKSYQACEHCRQRKARCVLEDPRDAVSGGCVRCRRERKKCVFSPERSTKASFGRAANSASASNAASAAPFPEDGAHSSTPWTTASSLAEPETDGPENTSPSPGQPPTLVSGPSPAESGLTSMTADLGLDNASLARPQGQPAPSDSGHDRTDNIVLSDDIDKHHALDLLLDAADYTVRPLDDSSSHGPGSSYNWCILRHPFSHVSQEVLDTWRLCPFVKFKWMTAQEAVTYVDLFYQNLAPLSLIVDNRFKDHASHHSLITSNQLLCSTILTISSRYHFLSGVASLSRGFLLHERLWEHCQSLLQKVIWGQGPRTKDVEKAVQTIESFLLLSEWHPRSFLSDHHGMSESSLTWPGEDEASTTPIPGAWQERVVEPIRIGDRTSWMMLGSAVAISAEHDLLHSVCGSKQTNESVNPEASQPQTPVQLRTHRAIRLLFIYINQLASRVGCSISKIPFHSELREIIYCNMESVEPGWHDIVTAWIDLVRLSRSASDILFPPGAGKNDLLQNGRYLQLLQHFQNLLQQWKNKYCGIPAWSSPQSPLQVEYQFLRIYINSISLQAISARTSRTSNSSVHHQFEIDAEESASIREIMDGCKEIFRAILRLSSTGQLKYIPNRISVRTASAVMYFVKALATGVPREEFVSSLDLLDQTLEALRSDTVDDVHISAHYASLLDSHMKSLRRRFVAISNPVISDISRAPSSFEPCLQPVGDVIRGVDTVDMAESEFDSWMVLPFDSCVSEPFELAFMQNIDGADIGDSSSFFWELLP